MGLGLGSVDVGDELVLEERMDHSESPSPPMESQNVLYKDPVAAIDIDTRNEQLVQVEDVV